MAAASVLGFEEQGSGPPLVLVSGLAGLGRFWEPVARAMAERFRVLSIDHPGLGRSAHLACERVEDIADQVAALADRLGIGRFALVGHSTGGAVAQALAVHHPQRCGRIVLSNTWARPDRRFAELFELRKLVLERLGEAAYGRLTDLLAYPGPLYEAHAAQRILVPAETVEAAAPAALMAKRIAMLLRFDLSRSLGSVRSRVLVVGAPDDAIVSFEHSQRLVQALPDARLVQVAGGHFSPRTNTAVYAQAITGFLEGADDAP